MSLWRSRTRLVSGRSPYRTLRYDHYHRLDQCQTWADAGNNLLPVWRRLVADDVTPVALLRRLQDEPQHFLFESVVGGESQARYSMLGCRPRARLVGDLQHLKVHAADGGEEVLNGEPYAALRGYLARFQTPELAELPRFYGGLVGYFAYDCVRLVEHLPDVPADQLGLPDIALMCTSTRYWWWTIVSIICGLLRMLISARVKAWMSLMRRP